MNLQVTARFIWRSFCWYLFFNVLPEIAMLVCYAAAAPGDYQNCLPLSVLSVALTAMAYWPLAVTLVVAQVAAALYLGWRSRDAVFWKKMGKLAKGALVFFLVTRLLAVIVNNADFPAWTAYKLANYVCREGHFPDQRE